MWWVLFGWLVCGFLFCFYFSLNIESTWRYGNLPLFDLRQFCTSLE